VDNEERKARFRRSPTSKKILMFLFSSPTDRASCPDCNGRGYLSEHREEVQEEDTSETRRVERYERYERDSYAPQVVRETCPRCKGSGVEFMKTPLGRGMPKTCTLCGGAGWMREWRSR
jgi:DnaJ-class molecular chaperone